MRITAHTHTRKRISLTPLIDVVFLLLIFFMLASTFAKFTSIDVKIETATTATSSTQGDDLHVKILSNGRLTIDGADIALAGLTKAMKKRKRRPKRALVTADPAVDVQLLVDVLARLRKTGLSEIKLAR